MIVIECTNKQKMKDILNKIESETAIKWENSNAPTNSEYDIGIIPYPVWLVISDDDTMKMEGIPKRVPNYKYRMSDDEFLALDLTLSSKSKDAKIVSNDSVNHPSHYTQGKVECIDAMEQVLGREAVMHYCLGATFKYLWRRKLKENEEQDIQKSLWYFDRFVEIINR